MPLRQLQLRPQRQPQRKLPNPMQLATGTVVGGEIIVDGEPIPDGTVVTILARDPHDNFEVPPELETELLESIAEAERGEAISADDLLRRLRRIARGAGPSF